MSQPPIGFRVTYEVVKAKPTKLTLDPDQLADMASRGIETRPGGLASAFYYWSARFLLALIGRNDNELRSVSAHLLGIARANHYPLLENLRKAVALLEQVEALRQQAANDRLPEPEASDD